MLAEMYKKSLYKILNSICTRTVFFVINGIQSKFFYYCTVIPTMSQLFEQNI